MEKERKGFLHKENIAQTLVLIYWQPIHRPKIKWQE